MGAFLPDYLTRAQLWVDILPVPIAAFVLAAFVAAIVKHEHSTFLHRFLAVAAFSLLGFVIGEMTGLSREPAVSATIGAVLGLLGGALAYLLGTKGPENQAFASAAVCVFVLSLFFGTSWGAALREDAEFYKRSAEYRERLELEDLKLRYWRAVNHIPDPAPAKTKDDGSSSP